MQSRSYQEADFTSSCAFLISGFTFLRGTPSRMRKKAASGVT